jgi:hypothetical protein
MDTQKGDICMQQLYQQKPKFQSKKGYQQIGKRRTSQICSEGNLLETLINTMITKNLTGFSLKFHALLFCHKNLTSTAGETASSFPGLLGRQPRSSGNEDKETVAILHPVFSKIIVYFF